MPVRFKTGAAGIVVNSYFFLEFERAANRGLRRARVAGLSNYTYRIAPEVIRFKLRAAANLKITKVLPGRETLYSPAMVPTIKRGFHLGRASKPECSPNENYRVLRKWPKRASVTALLPDSAQTENSSPLQSFECGVLRRARSIPPAHRRERVEASGALVPITASPERLVYWIGSLTIEIVTPPPDAPSHPASAKHI